MLKPYLAAVVSGRSLSADELGTAVGLIMDGQATPAQIGALLAALRMKGETAEEVSGAARAMRARMLRVETPAGAEVLDTCGTGGDGAGTLNISTGVAFVAAGAGAVVAKHGNRAVSSRCGSADVLSELGVAVELGPEDAARALREVGIAFLFAPRFHPAMKHAMPIRRELGVRTIFNLLGPLTNPASAPRQLVGVYSDNWVEPLARALGLLGSRRAIVAHGSDGLDELTLCGVTRLAHWDGERMTSEIVAPEDFGLSRAKPEALRGGAPAENAAALLSVLQGQPSAAADAVLFNAGAALVAAGLAADLADGVQRARQVIASGAALAKLEALRAFRQGHPA